MGVLPDRRLVLGISGEGWVLARPEHAVMVLGPPRSGKTHSLVIPNVAGAPGPVVSTSTKPDVMEATVRARASRGRCWLYDPTGQVTPAPGVERLRWSPVLRAADWDDAVRSARTMVLVARHRATGEQQHWDERAQAVLAPLLHAAALAGEPLRTVARWVNRRESAPALSTLDAAGSGLAVDALLSATASEERELSGIWSTTSGVLAAYRTEAALATTDHADFRTGDFVRSSDTIYICAPGRHQDVVAPLVSELVDEIQLDRYLMHARPEGRAHPAVVLALDEVANIAPLPELPATVSEGGGQGVMTLACFQDLSQAGARWGEGARAFPTLFGSKLVLPGVADVTTLQALSALVGDHDVTTRSRSRTGRAGQWATSWAVRRQPRLAVDEIRRGRSGHALLLEADAPASWIALAGRGHERDVTMGNGAPAPRSRGQRSAADRPFGAAPDPRGIDRDAGWSLGR